MEKLEVVKDDFGSTLQGSLEQKLGKFSYSPADL